MLDLLKLQDQLAEMSTTLGERALEVPGRVAAALSLLERGQAGRDGLAERLLEYEGLGKRPWILAQPVDELDGTYPLAQHAGPYTVVATDGSQIAPSHHEVALCYLINVGRILYTYGTGEMPIQESRPKLYSEEMIREDALALKRHQAESRQLVELTALGVGRGHPTLALVDGTLIQFKLEPLMDKLQEEVLNDYLADMERLFELRVPVAGYLSNSRSADVVNLLRLVACPREKLACPCQAEDLPCEEEHIPLNDRRMWAERLKPGERSPLFHSASRIFKLADYPEHQKIMFFYLHVGSEIARLEVPRWVAEDVELLDRVHALAYDQARKGHGYPIALQEAHNQAVVGREDRTRFFMLLSQRLAGAGVAVQVSNKELKKRVGVV